MNALVLVDQGELFASKLAAAEQRATAASSARVRRSPTSSTDPDTAGAFARSFLRAFRQMTGYEQAEAARIVRQQTRQQGSQQRQGIRATVVGRLWSRFTTGKVMRESSLSLAAAAQADAGGALWGTGPDAVDNGVWEMAALEWVEFGTPGWEEGAADGTVKRECRTLWPGRALLLALADLVDRAYARMKAAREQLPQKYGGAGSTSGSEPGFSSAGGTARPPGSVDCPF